MVPFDEVPCDEVTCDELIKGERKKEKPASVPTASPISILQATENPLSQAFHRFKIQNIISACISLLSVIAGIGIKELLTYVTYDYSANVFSLCITLCGSLISLACTVIFNIMFKNKLTQANDAYSYRFKANRISFLNSYLCLLSFSLVLSLTARYGYIFIMAALAVMIIIEIFTKRPTSANTKLPANIFLLILLIFLKNFFMKSAVG